jgi:hypothetical protein
MKMTGRVGAAAEAGRFAGGDPHAMASSAMTGREKKEGPRHR